MAMDAGLVRSGHVRDPATNSNMTDETVIALCARHVYNDNELPARLGQHVLNLMGVITDEQRVKDENIRLISEVADNYIDITYDDMPDTALGRVSMVVIDAILEDGHNYESVLGALAEILEVTEFTDTELDEFTNRILNLNLDLR
jgi:hypothetical protein